MFIHDHQGRKGLTANNPSPPATAEVASVFSLERAPVVLPSAQPALVWRGQQDTSAKQIKDLQQALVPYDSGDYAGAARLLELLRKKYPRMAQAPFYLGVCQLFLGQNDAAVRSLQDAQDLAGPSLADQTTWYLALANVKTGKIDKAKSLLTERCSAEGKDSARACAGVKELEGQH
jgi:TolA-binding protein